MPFASLSSMIQQAWATRRETTTPRASTRLRRAAEAERASAALRDVRKRIQDWRQEMGLIQAG